MGYGKPCCPANKKGDKKKAQQAFEKKKGSFGIEISNFDKDATRHELIAFLNQQVTFTFQTCDLVEGPNGFPVLNLTLKDRNEANQLLGLSGKTWRNRKLVVKPIELQNTPQQPKVQNQLLPHHIEQLYNSKESFLNLNNLNGSQDVRCNLNSYPFLQILWKILSEKCPGVKTIALGYNGITTLKGFANLQDFCPDVINISFEGNQVSNFEELDNLKGLRLRELLFNQNPIASMPNYHSEVCRRFSGLRYLDKCRTKPLIQFNLPAHVINTTLPEIHGSYFDAEDHSNLVIEWIAMYLKLYDNKEERVKLIDVYETDARFSMSAVIPSDDKKFKKNKSTFDNVPEHSIKFYEPFSRNLLQVSSAAQRQKLLLQSNVDVVSLIKNLPPTKHSLNDIVCDSNLLTLNGSQLLMVSLHGIFWEKCGPTAGVNRNFSRVFTLKPAAPNSRASVEGWKAVISNEMFTIYDYVGHLPNTEDTIIEDSTHTTTTTTTTTTAPLSSSLSLSNDLFSSGTFSLSSSSASPSASFGSSSLSASFGTADMSKKKYDMIMKLCAVSNLKEEWAEKMLESTNWDYQMTVYNFMMAQERGEIAKEYFK